jgi:hypothetical protein
MRIGVDLGDDVEAVGELLVVESQGHLVLLLPLCLLNTSDDPALFAVAVGDLDCGAIT